MKNNIFNLDPVVVGSKVPIKDLTMNKALMLRKILAGGKAIDQTVSGNAPLVLPDAVAHSILSLKQYGLCTQDGTPTPSAPVDIVCNNGAIKFGWHDIITTSQLNGYGTYVSRSQMATTRAYRWFRDLPNGTYTFAVSGDYEIIVQWRDPADPADGLAQYENLTGWITSGEVTLGKTTGGYGIAVRRTSGTDSITPSNFDGILHVQERGLYIDGTPEVLTVSATGAETQTVTDIPMLLSVGDYKDEGEIISGIKTGKVGIKVFDGTETATLQSINSYGIANFYIGVSNKVPSVAALLCTHFKLQTSSIELTTTEGILNGATAVYFRVNSATASTPQELSALFAAQYAAGTPVIVLYPLATSTTESVTPQNLVTHQGTNIVDSTANVSLVGLEIVYKKKK